MNYISFIDIFGVQFRQQISYHVKSQKSLIGGITSLIILIASFGYLAYILHEWISFNLLPKLTNTMMADQTSELLYFEDESLFEFAYWKYSQFNVSQYTRTNKSIPLAILFIQIKIVISKCTITEYNKTIDHQTIISQLQLAFTLTVIKNLKNFHFQSSLDF